MERREFLMKEKCFWRVGAMSSSKRVKKRRVRRSGVERRELELPDI